MNRCVLKADEEPVPHHGTSPAWRLIGMALFGLPCFLIFHYSKNSLFHPFDSPSGFATLGWFSLFLILFILSTIAIVRPRDEEWAVSHRGISRYINKKYDTTFVWPSIIYVEYTPGNESSHGFFTFTNEDESTFDISLNENDPTRLCEYILLHIEEARIERDTLITITDDLIHLHDTN